jgi:hypothetical protein
MLSNNNEKQKSPKRRFLLILGVTAFRLLRIWVNDYFLGQVSATITPNTKNHIRVGDLNIRSFALFALFKKGP